MDRVTTKTAREALLEEPEDALVPCSKDCGALCCGRGCDPEHSPEMFIFS